MEKEKEEAIQQEHILVINSKNITEIKDEDLIKCTDLTINLDKEIGKYKFQFLKQKNHKIKLNIFSECENVRKLRIIS